MVDKTRFYWKADQKEMIRVEAGEFLFGDDKIKLELPEFWIDKTLVTNGEYWRFVVATGYRPPAHWCGDSPGPEIEHHPVVNVFWSDAAAYAAWAGKHLLSEQEWEKAARGMRGGLYPWGDQEPTPDLCNFGMNTGTTTPVGTYSPQGDSPYGCVDMSGNVWEWTDSWFASNKKYRVLRGGGFRFRAEDARAAYRISLLSESCYNDVGFRLVVRGTPVSQ